jgi:hypothetical protein
VDGADIETRHAAFDAGAADFDRAGQYARLEFRSGALGEGEGDDRFGGGALGQQTGNSARNALGLARTRAGNDLKVSTPMGYDSLLLGTGVERGHGGSATACSRQVFETGNKGSISALLSQLGGQSSDVSSAMREAIARSTATKSSCVADSAIQSSTSPRSTPARSGTTHPC